MVNNTLVKWFMRIWCVFMAVSIAMTAVSAGMTATMDSIVYTCSGEDACIIQLDFENRQVRYMKYTSEYANRWMTGQMSAFMAFRLKFAAALAHAPLWLERYSADDAENANAWAMDMHFGNHVWTTQGMGAYPFRWRILIPKIMAVAELFPKELPSTDVPDNIGAVPM